ncbi:MAG: DUF2075 domain-containing protein [Gelidibacter sp.]|nr:DUF2075 domain-containing protein [Gelidibacter sp.]
MLPHKPQSEIKKHYSVYEIINLSSSDIIWNIKNFLDAELDINEFSNGQILAWEKSIKLLKSIFIKENGNWQIIFEFPIPLSSGKRPDILLINGVTIFLIEVKNKSNYTLGDIDQLKGYQSDLKFYHTTAHLFEIVPILLLLEEKNIFEEINEIHIVGFNKLKELLLKSYQKFQMINSKSLYDGQFKPIPSITEYAKSVFANKKIENIESLMFNDSKTIYIELRNIYEEVKENNKKAIVFIRGEAGTGKSAIGLNSAYKFNGLYVTKNRQFSEHLINELGYYSNIKTSHNFLKEFSRKKEIPYWDTIIFDEAQRFWNYSKMKEYFSVEKSEHEFVIDLFSKKDWCLLIVLIGEGQDLGWGEYSDLELWKNALQDSKSEWDVYGTKSTKKKLGYSKEFKFVVKDNFDLYSSFRNIKSPNYSTFVNKILDYEEGLKTKNFEILKKEYSDIKEKGFKIIITRNLDQAVDYCKERYFNSPNSYCTLTSAQSAISADRFDENVQNKAHCDYSISSKLNINNYLKQNGINDVKDECLYPLTEFSAIGFEVEMPILVWGFDLLWYKNRWNYEFLTYLNGNSHYRKNAYRVLLTRGRDGIILFFPQTWEFDNSFNFFRELGTELI